MAICATREMYISIMVMEKSQNRCIFHGMLAYDGRFIVSKVITSQGDYHFSYPTFLRNHEFASDTANEVGIAAAL